MSEYQWRIIAVYRGDKNKPADVRKANDMITVFSFVSKMNDYPMFVGDSLIMALVPNKVETDDLWFVNDVFRFVDIQRSTSDIEAKRMADRLVNLAREKDPEGSRYAGAGLIRLYAHQMYMKYEEWTPDALRFEVKL